MHPAETTPYSGRCVRVGLANIMDSLDLEEGITTKFSELIRRHGVAALLAADYDGSVLDPDANQHALHLS